MPTSRVADEATRARGDAPHGEAVPQASLYGVARGGGNADGDELLLLDRFLDVHHELTGAQTLVHVSIDGAALKASMPPCVGNAVIDNILARALAAADSPVHVNVEPAGAGTRARDRLPCVACGDRRRLQLLGWTGRMTEPAHP